LGQKLKEAGLPFDLFVGDSDISYRMYNDGIRSLLQGWTKNIAAGASKTHWYLFITVFLAITSMASVPIHIATYSWSGDYKWLVLYVAFYMIWVIVLFVLARKAGRFHLVPILFYPILIIVLVYIFLISMIKKVFGLKVVWKGRAINK
jgi:4,4'-diaponeurosporenoate glycosyltransferase